MVERDFGRRQPRCRASSAYFREKSKMDVVLCAGGEKYHITRKRRVEKREKQKQRFSLHIVMLCF